MTDYIKLAILRREELNAEFRSLEKFILKADELSGDKISLTEALVHGSKMPNHWDEGTWPIDEAIGNETIEVNATTRLRPLKEEPKGTQYDQLTKLDKRLLAMIAAVMIGVFGWYIWQAMGDRIWEYGQRLGWVHAPVVELVVPDSVKPTWDGIWWQFTFKTKQGEAPIITIFDKPGAEADCKAVRKLTLEGVDPADVVIKSCIGLR